MIFDDRVYFNVACTNNIYLLPGTGWSLDVNNRAIQYWYAEPKIFTGEVNIVLTQWEKGSWLLTMLYVTENVRSLFWILSDFSGWTVCRIHLKHPRLRSARIIRCGQ
jgi:hypothetical protein